MPRFHDFDWYDRRGFIANAAGVISRIGFDGAEFSVPGYWSFLMRFSIYLRG